jgi:hypothetical protein
MFLSCNKFYMTPIGQGHCLCELQSSAVPILHVKTLLLCAVTTCVPVDW